MPPTGERDRCRCARCGVAGDRRSFRRRLGWRGRRWLCPTCAATLDRRGGLELMAVVLAGLPLALLAQALAGPSIVTHVVLSVSGFYLLMVAQVVPHELGHAAVARLTGFRVFRITFGEGRPVAETQVGGTAVQLCELPLGGATWALTTTTRWYRLRRTLVVAGGLAATTAIGVAAWRWSVEPGTFAGELRRLVVWSSAALVVLNLIPRRLRRPEGELVTDGWQLATTAFLSADEVAEAVAQHDRVAALELRRHGDLDGALDAARALTDRPGASVEDALVLLVSLEAAERWDDAAALVRRLLADDDADDDRRAVLGNDLAWCDLMLGDPALLAEADEASARALALRGWHPGVMSTRGSVLVELGRLAEGLELLRAVERTHRDPEGRAANLCYLAIGEARRGDLFTARSHLALARRTDPSCSLLGRAEAEVEALALARARAEQPG